MKKMKGVAAAAAAAMEYSPYHMYEEQRTRFKHESLLQDYSDLHKETEAMKTKLQTVKEKKLILLAEVRFLRRRHKFLMQNRLASPLAEMNSVQPHTMMIRSTSFMKKRVHRGKEPALGRQVSGSDLKRKKKTSGEKEAFLGYPSPLLDLNRKQPKAYGGKEVVENPMPDLGLNEKERVLSGKEAVTRSMVPVFDLNQISREEEELEASDDLSSRPGELRRSLIRGGGDELLCDLKLSACRNTGSGANRVGKRKITWQDQVALRV